jgi:uncharacterized membrane protein/protein-disulfide isomerase
MNSDSILNATRTPRSGLVTRREAKPLPYHCYLAGVLGLCLAGIGLCVYLAISHYRIHTDLDYQSFCALTRAINCDTVSQSRYSVMAGAPVSVWGIFGYFGFIVMALLSTLNLEPERRMWTICQATALAFCAAGLAFAAVSTFLVKSYCIVCIATYAVNFALLFVSWLIRRRFHAGGYFWALAEDIRFLWSKRAVSAPLLGLLALGLTATAVAFPAYWEIGPADRGQKVGGGLTEDGAPYIGAVNPMIEIVEFTDYQCFQCRKMHYYLRTLVARYPGQIRLTHRHYPMDHEFNPIVTEPFHVGSGRMALLAIHAAMTGRFLEMNDLLFRKASEGNDIDLDAIRREIGDEVDLGQALVHPPYLELLLRDIRYGMKLRVMGTPAFLVDGKIFTGSIPSEVLKALVDKAEAAIAAAGRG